MTPTEQRQAFQETVRLGSMELTLRDLVSADQSAFLALHRLVFGGSADARWYDWKYGDGPQNGHGHGLGLWHGTSLIAHCAGVPRTLWQHGAALAGLQIGDVMVHPDWRQFLTRHGPFFWVSHGFYSRWLGAPGERAFQLGFGFPSLRHLRLAKLLELMHDGGRIESLHWPALASSAAPLPWAWRWQELDPSDADFDRQVNAAWRAMRRSTQALTLGERDAAYVRWRYMRRPPEAEPTGPLAASCRYRFFRLSRTWPSWGTALAVLDLQARPVQWLDWIGPLDWLTPATRACQLQAGAVGATELAAWASAAVAARLTATPPLRREVCAGLGLPAHAGLDTQTLDTLNFWLMGGDTDFL